MNNTFILLARSILDSQVFANDKMLKIWVWCLCKANHKKSFVPLKVGKGFTEVEVKRGQFIFGRSKAEDELFYDGSTIYKIMQKFEKLEMISIESNNQFSIITICNYDTYQTPDNYTVTTKEQASSKQRTSKSQPSNTYKNDNNVNNEENEKEIINPLDLLTEEEKEIWDSFTNWFKGEGFKVVSKIQNQLEPHQLFKLLETYDAEEIKDTLLSLENYKKAKDYTSVYLTLNKWLKKQTV